MIHSFACKKTEDLFNSKATVQFKSIERVARRKLLQLHAVTELLDLRIPPGNMLEGLKGVAVRGNTAFESIISGEFAFYGKKMVFIT
jgi:plasmid maintenance system killer protein